MKIQPASYYLHDEFYGEGKVKSFHRYGTTLFPTSILYYCPQCGDAWGRIRVQFSGWSASKRCCPDHGPGLLYPFQEEFFEIPSRVLSDTILKIGKLRRGPIYFYPHLITGEN